MLLCSRVMCCCVVGLCVAVSCVISVDICYVPVALSMQKAEEKNFCFFLLQFAS